MRQFSPRYPQAPSASVAAVTARRPAPPSQVAGCLPSWQPGGMAGSSLMQTQQTMQSIYASLASGQPLSADQIAMLQKMLFCPMPTPNGMVHSIVGVRQTAVANAAQTTTAQQTLSDSFQLKQLIVPSSNAPFLIDDIKFANKSGIVFPNGSGHSDAFSELTQCCIEFDAPMVPASQDIEVLATNISGAAADFNAVLVGFSFRC